MPLSRIMNDSYAIFESQLNDACNSFQNLRVKSIDGKCYLKGTLDILNTDNILVGSFLIEVRWSEGFPYRFPALFEVGGDIPCEPDWHKYKNNSCCVTVEPDEIHKCKHGITVTQFISNYAIPYFANQCYKRIEGKYFDEYPHGKEGLIRYYTELMGTSDTNLWREYLELAFGKRPLKIKRDDPCICKNGKKFEKCHLKTFETLRDIGIVNINRHFSQISL
ncbi:MAG: hypothetical protein WC946_08135 [Bacteroidales bacterium]